MSKTEFKSQRNDQSDFSDSLSPLKNEQQTLAEVFRGRNTTTERPFIERFFVELNDALLSSMDAAK